MSGENTKIPVLSSKSIDLLERLENSFKKIDLRSSDSFVQNAENADYKNQLTWVVKKTDLMTIKSGKCLRSPNVDIHFRNTHKLWLEIYPKVLSSDGSFIDLIVCFDNLSENVFLECDAFVLKKDRDVIWEESFSGGTCDLKEMKINFKNVFLGVDRYHDHSLNEMFLIECRINLVAATYQCSVPGQLLKKYTVNAAPKSSLYMEDIINSGKYSDVDLKVESKILKAHKCILSSESPEFKILFKLVHGNEHELNGEKYDTIKELLNYVYTGKIKISGFCHAFQLYQAAHKYEVFSLKELCSAYLNGNILEKNISEVFDLSRKYDDEYLFKACLAFIKKNDIDLSAKSFIQKNKE